MRKTLAQRVAARVEADLGIRFDIGPTTVNRGYWRSYPECVRWIATDDSRKCWCCSASLAFTLKADSLTTRPPEDNINPDWWIIDAEWKAFRHGKTKRLRTTAVHQRAAHTLKPA